MKIKTVTITGADDSVEPSALIRLSAKFPFVEWGILLSNIYIGTPRFPSHAWLSALLLLWNKNRIALSGHICGRWVRDICEGNWPSDPALSINAIMFRRLQLNFHSYLHIVERPGFVASILDQTVKGKQIIFQLDDTNDGLLPIAKSTGADVVPLYDISGGAGILPETWPKGIFPLSGYAGGLSPSNIMEQLPLISSAAGTVPFWIDIETHVRSNDNQLFDLTKVEEFLDIMREYIEPITVKVLSK